jgi:hypothetical protein
VLGDSETEAAALGELEASFVLKRGWNVDGAANVYFRGKATLWAVGQNVVACHRFHRSLGARRMPQNMRGTRPVRLLPSLSSFGLASACHVHLAYLRSPIIIAQVFDFHFAGSASFHREVVRDLSRLRSVLTKSTRERSPADKSLLLRYAGTTVVLRTNHKGKEPEAIIGQSE